MNTLFVRDDRKLLKCKIKSLAAESRIIRLEERRTSHDPLRESMYLHRTRDLRRESRSALLAYGYIRGRTMSQMENSYYSLPNWDRILRLVKKYGANFDQTKFDSWKDQSGVLSSHENVVKAKAAA